MDSSCRDTLSEQEAVSRAMLEFCGLGWDDRCLRPHEADRTTRTASFDQVRQPIYKKSVQRWRNYENHLDELKAGLERGF